jgi:hypothetical protein
MIVSLLTCIPCLTSQWKWNSSLKSDRLGLEIEQEVGTSSSTKNTRLDGDLC